MIFYPTSDDVLDALGDKVIDSFAMAVDRAREDLASYRAMRPLWVAESSERGLAAWIHDRLWAHLEALLHNLPDVFMHSSEPTREVVVSERFRVRVKRHDILGSVSSYPTQGALEFFAQPTVAAFDGMEQVHLIAGYCWTRDMRDIGEAVLSLRDGRDNIVWLIELNSRAAAASMVARPAVTPTPIIPTVEIPRAPMIEIVQPRSDNESQESS